MDLALKSVMENFAPILVLVPISRTWSVLALGTAVKLPRHMEMRIRVATQRKSSSAIPLTVGMDRYDNEFRGILEVSLRRGSE